MRADDERRMWKLNVACFFALTGTVLAFYENWRIALAVFLLWWAANIMDSLK